jgi:hypothetical protein
MSQPFTDAFSTTSSGKDIFVAKLNPQGNMLLYSSYFGGSRGDMIYSGGLALDPAGNIYVAGNTHSNGFPARNPLQGSFAGLP